MKPLFICRFIARRAYPIANPPGLKFHLAAICLLLIALFEGGLSCRADIFFPTQDGTGGYATNILTPVPNSGILRIDYDFYTIPDQLDVYYDGTDLFSSGMIAGTGHFDIPYGPGVSDSLFIVIDKDGATDPNTAWHYMPSVAPVPEPAVAELLAVGLFALGFAAKMRSPGRAGARPARAQQCPTTGYMRWIQGPLVVLRFSPLPTAFFNAVHDCRRPSSILSRSDP